MNAEGIAMQDRPEATDADRSRPWYAEPMLWLVVTIPALAVVAGLSTVVIAHLRSDTVVADDYRKEGIAINRDPTRDLASSPSSRSPTARSRCGSIRAGPRDRRSSSCCCRTRRGPSRTGC
jgi:hypothetical protein